MNAFSFANGESLASIEALMASADYEQAQKIISEKLKENKLSSEYRAQLYWHKAVCHLSQNQIALARASFFKLLASAPFFKPGPDISPKILALYTETYETLKAQGGIDPAIKSTFIPLETSIAGEGIPFQVKIEDPHSRKQLNRLELHIRRLGNSEFSSIDFAESKNELGLFEANVPAVLTKHVEAEAIFEYYVDFLSSGGARISGIGKRALPLTFCVNVKARPADEEAITKTRKTFTTAAIWVSAATLTLGAIVAAAFVFSGPKEGSLNVKVLSAG